MKRYEGVRMHPQHSTHVHTRTQRCFSVNVQQMRQPASVLSFFCRSNVFLQTFRVGNTFSRSHTPHNSCRSQQCSAVGVEILFSNLIKTFVYIYRCRSVCSTRVFCGSKGEILMKEGVRVYLQINLVIGAQKCPDLHDLLEVILLLSVHVLRHPRAA